MNCSDGEGQSSEPDQWCRGQIQTVRQRCAKAVRQGTGAEDIWRKC